jgi:hypothetical protein
VIEHHLACFGCVIEVTGKALRAAVEKGLVV